MSEISKEQSTSAGSVYQQNIWGRLAEIIQSLSTLWVIVILALFFSLTSEYFFTVENFYNIIKQMSIVGVLAIGMTMVILIGGMDLSVGSIVLLSAAVTGTLVNNYGFSPLGATLVGIFAGVIVGFINGTIIARLRVSPVIVTLATQIAFRGAGQAILWINNSWVYFDYDFFSNIASKIIIYVPIVALIMFVLYLIASIFMKETPIGRYIYAIGGNPLASKLAGVQVDRIRVLVYTLCGLCAGVAGILTASRSGVVGPSVGNGMEFDAITAVVLGGTRMSGGVGRVEKSLLGTAILVMVLNYLTIKGIPGIWQAAVMGFLILAAALIDQVGQHKKVQS